MAKEFLVKGAVCMCKFGVSPGTFTALDNSSFYLNGHKLAGTTLSLGNTFDPPGFGTCKVNPAFPKPCAPSLTKWSSPFTGIKTAAGGSLLTESSKGTCASGGPDCISVVRTGQVPVPGASDYQKAAFQFQADIDPTGSPAGLTEHQIALPLDIDGEFIEPDTMYNEEPFEIEIIGFSKGNFVPLGIPNKQSDKDVNGQIKVSFNIKYSNAKEYGIKVKNRYNVTIYEEYFLSEVSVSPKNTCVEGYRPGSYTFEWNGFDRDDIYDTTEIKDKLYIEIVGVGVNGKSCSDQKTVQCGEMDVKWIDVKINKRSKQIDVLLRLDLKDGGAVGLTGGGGIPQKSISTYKHPPIKERTKTFDDLKLLFFDGVAKYWSRKVVIGKEEYTVKTTAIHSEKNCMDDLVLRYVTNDTPGRSSNPGSATLDPYTWLANIAYQRVYYNVGYIKFNDWMYILGNSADSRFKATAAHEIGHEILKSFRGAKYSYEHKGTSTKLQNVIPDNPYPVVPEEIDLMKYYSDMEPQDFFTRVVVAEEDMLGMLWLTKIEIK